MRNVIKVLYFLFTHPNESGWTNKHISKNIGLSLTYVTRTTKFFSLCENSVLTYKTSKDGRRYSWNNDSELVYALYEMVDTNYKTY